MVKAYCDIQVHFRETGRENVKWAKVIQYNVKPEVLLMKQLKPLYFLMTTEILHECDFRIIIM
jgi:hypothetical protein